MRMTIIALAILCCSVQALGGDVPGALRNGIYFTEKDSTPFKGDYFIITTWADHKIMEGRLRDGLDTWPFLLHLYQSDDKKIWEGLTDVEVKNLDGSCFFPLRV